MSFSMECRTPKGSKNELLVNLNMMVLNLSIIVFFM